jgi:5-(carboxyamino)imidazole ribonucleotide mutase
MAKVVAIIMGSDSDLSVMSESAKTLDEFGVEYELTVVSAHRTPQKMYEFAESAKEKGLKVIIAAAGGAAHLPGMTASMTTLPVIGVPIKSKTLDGVDSFLSISQMPPGVPVATMAINGAKNAALMAVEILAVADSGLSKKLEEYKAGLKSQVYKKAKKLENIGFDKYQKEK